MWHYKNRKIYRGDRALKVKNIFKRLFEFKPNEKRVFELSSQRQNIDYDVRDEAPQKSAPLVSSSIDENEAYIRDRFSVPLNNDFIIRKLRLQDGRRAFVVFIEGMVSTDNVDAHVIKSLQELPYYSEEDGEKTEERIAERFISHNQTMITPSMDVVAEEVNFGAAAVFVDGCDKAFSIDIRSWGTRSINKPENEQSIYGPQEAFAEMLRTNTALIRKIIKTEKLIAEGVKIGTVSKTRGVLLYIKDIANGEIVEEARRRIKGIDMEYVISIEEVEMMIEEKSFGLTTQMLKTERPDRVARALTEGKAALILNGSPTALVFPATIFELSHAASDDYLRVPYANMSRLIRLVTTFASMLLPGLYLATTLYHQEVIPTYLLYSISASRENVPFPSVIELILMDISFEMIREAGLRMPGPIGSTLGIVGGLILGQAAVSAKIVSPIMIIVIALTGIGSFATPDYSLGWSYRLLRLLFIAAGALLGFYGIAAGIVIYSLLLGNMKSFGVPFVSPMPKRGGDGTESAVFMNPIWKKEKRPAFLKPKSSGAEPKISRKWRKK